MTPSVRALVSFAAPIAVAAAMLAGCTFLISFDDVAQPNEGGTTSDGPGVPPDVHVDGEALTDASVEAGADARDALANPDACKGAIDGKYCGGDQIVWPAPGTKDDLITCTKNVVTNVRVCTAGLGCIRMINGYPDQCDECASKADGVYCGRDMPGWDAKNADTRVRCQNHAEVGLLLCAAGCSSNGGSSACK